MLEPGFHRDRFPTICSAMLPDLSLYLFSLVLVFLLLCRLSISARIMSKFQYLLLGVPLADNKSNIQTNNFQDESSVIFSSQ